MPAFSVKLSPWLAALWWGSMTILGGMVVPLLFAHLPTPGMAGQMAAKLFTTQTWLSVVCALLLLLIDRSNHAARQSQQAQGATIFIVLGMLLALLSEFAVAPRIISRENLRWWHSIGTLMFIAQWGCAALTFRKQLESNRFSV